MKYLQGEMVVNMVVSIVVAGIFLFAGYTVFTDHKRVNDITQFLNAQIAAQQKAAEVAPAQ